MKPKWRIAVLYGGDSSEREVSLRTGEAIAKALSERGHYVRPIDVRNKSLEELDKFEYDLAYIALHGAFGEDGQVQLLLETRGIPYTGSGVEASRLAMDKAAAKERFIERGIITPAFRVVSEREPAESIRRAIVEIGFPQIIKPSREGSSIGLALARNMCEAIEGVKQAFKCDERVLVEQFIKGRELTVGIIGRQTLPIIELKYPGAVFDNNAKYTKGVTEHIVRPEMPEEVDERVRMLAFAAHEALGCRDISRVDIMLAPDNTPYVLEVNTVPGMTETSLVPDAAKHAGMEFADVCEKVARFAINAHSAVRRPHQGG